MPLVMAKCTNCGGVLEIDSSKDAVICTYCGTPFISEKAVNNYTNNIEHLHADTVVLSNGQSVESLIKAGAALLEAGSLNSAQPIFKKLIDNYPEDYRSWYSNGQFQMAIYCNVQSDQSHYEALSSLKNALVLAPDDRTIRVKIDSTYKLFSTEVETYKNNVTAINQEFDEEFKRLDDRRFSEEKKFNSEFYALNQKRHKTESSFLSIGLKHIDRQISEKRSEYNAFQQMYQQKFKELEAKKLEYLNQAENRLTSCIKPLIAM